MSKRHEARYEVARACMALEGEEDRTRMRTNQKPQITVVWSYGCGFGIMVESDELTSD